VLGVAGVAALTSLGVAHMVVGDLPPVTVVREVVSAPNTTTTAPGALPPARPEETRLEIPAGPEFLSGVVPYRGGPSRTGILEGEGVPRVDGFYWTYETAGPIVATPVAYGRNLLVPSTDGTLYALDMTTGRVAWTLRTEGRITASPAVANRGERPALVVSGGGDGVLRAREAVAEIQAEQWSIPLGTRITASPVVAGDAAFVATSDGFVHAVGLARGNRIWTYPPGEEGVGPISAPLAYHEGVLYVGTERGSLYLLEAANGSLRCEFFASAAVVANPILDRGAMYLPTRGNTIFLRPAGTCEGSVAERLPLYGTETAVEVPPAISGDVMFLPSGQFLYAIDLHSNEHVWPASTVDAGSTISAAPVVAGDAVYFGTQAGRVWAVDATSGETLWTWDTGNFVRSSPVVVDGAVFVASGDGNVYALGAR
ncbi:MAG: PQQ-binding-like beta-propeller repeat protein, partial [Actinomycetota bacterium]